MILNDEYQRSEVCLEVCVLTADLAGHLGQAQAAMFYSC